MSNTQFIFLKLMKNILLLIAILFTSTVTATTPIMPAWEQELLERIRESDLDGNQLKIEYGLTDECRIRDHKVLESPSKDIFTKDIVSKIVDSHIGPHYTDVEVVWEPADYLDSNLENRKLTSGTKVVYWPSTEGRKYIQCFFSDKEVFLYAEYVHPNIAPAPTAPRLRINEKLSELGTNLYILDFNLDESELRNNLLISDLNLNENL